MNSRWRSLGAISLIVLGFASIAGSAQASDYLCRDVGDGWTWFSDHMAASIEYLIVGPPGRRYEVGTGVMIAGAPRGWRSKHSDNAKVNAWGAGAIHVRKKDDGAPFKVCVGSGKLEPITIIKREF